MHSSATFAQTSSQAVGHEVVAVLVLVLTLVLVVGELVVVPPVPVVPVTVDAPPAPPAPVELVKFVELSTPVVTVPLGSSMVTSLPQPIAAMAVEARMSPNHEGEEEDRARMTVLLS